MHNNRRLNPRRIINLLPVVLMTVSCQMQSDMNKPTPPSAKKEPKKLEVHGDTRIDNYFWMRLTDEQKEAETPDAQTQQVLDYLNSENDYLKASLKHTEKLQDDLYEEITGRIKQDDESVPFKKNGYEYYTRFEKGQDYALYCRKALGDRAKEEVMLDGPTMGKDKSYFALGGMNVSKNNQLLVYGVDYVSRREYTLFVKDLSSGKVLEDKIEKTTGSAVWANDNKTIFYTKKDPQTLRSFQVYKHRLGTPQSQDELVFEEEDETYYCSVWKSKSEDYIMIGTFQTLSSEYRVLDANNPDGEWKVIQEREKDHLYSVNHFGDHFYIISNDGAKNFKLMKTPIDKTDKSNWVEVIGHRPDVLLEDIEIFKQHFLLTERINGLTQLRVCNWDSDEHHYIKFDDPTYMAYVGQNPDFESNTLRFGYSSLTTPNTIYDYELDTKDRKLMKRTEVIDDEFKPENYKSERIFVTVRDGAKVPVSIVYHKDTELSDKTPLLLYAYGSYGSSMDAYFSSVRLSLLNRGFVYAIAHIRGGEEMGRHWYEDGKLLKKKNTFYDFIDCAKALVDKGYTSSEHLYAMGGSAGGLLMGAVVNMEPELWNGVIAAVPFVDVVSTMLDETIPLTTFEFDEWGNPKDKKYYDYMLSYSPYDNVEAKDYPNMLVTTGYWDSQVQYWEPAKWVAKLRDLKTDDNTLLLYCNMEVGHGGASGRFRRYKETAMEYAFLLDLEGITE